MIRDFIGARPRFDESNFIADSAVVIGDVTLGPDSSVWFNATVRGDVNWIRIGERTNIQDNAVIHVTRGTGPTTIGDRVTIGHSAVVHACTIRDRVLIGMAAILMDGCLIGSDCIIGAGTLVTQRTEIPPCSLVIGRPAKVVRALSAEEIDYVWKSSENYVRYKSIYQGREVPEANPFYGH